MRLLKRVAHRLLRKDMCKAANIITGVATLKEYIKYKCEAALATQRPSELTPSNEYEAESFSILALVGYDPAKPHIDLNLKCGDADVLVLVADWLSRSPRFRAWDIELDDSSLRCRIVGLPSEQIKLYLQLVEG